MQPSSQLAFLYCTYTNLNCTPIKIGEKKIVNYVEARIGNKEKYDREKFRIQTSSHLFQCDWLRYLR